MEGSVGVFLLQVDVVSGCRTSLIQRDCVLCGAHTVQEFALGLVFDSKDGVACALA